MTSMLGAGITVGGFLGGISCGVLSDLVFKGSRIQPILVFTTGKSREWFMSLASNTFIKSSLMIYYTQDK